MDNNNCYRINITKWLPFPDNALKSWFSDTAHINDDIQHQAQEITLIIDELQNDNVFQIEAMDQCTTILQSIIDTYKAVKLTQETLNCVQIIYKYKVEYLSSTIELSLNSLTKFVLSLINEIVNYRDDEFLRKLFGLINIYNEMVKLKGTAAHPSINIFSNDCPSFLETIKPISIKRILQILARNAAEKHCHELIECLLTTYRSLSEDKIDSPLSCDVEMSENSSVEIYRALTKHMTPPGTATAPRARGTTDTSDTESIEILVDNQVQQIQNLMTVAEDISPRLFDLDSARLDDKRGTKMTRKARARLTDYYQGVSWAAISSILDHVILWWSPEGIAARHNHGAHHLKDWLHQFVQGSHDVPTSVRPALLNLSDTLGCHVTTTYWDELFREAYIAAFENNCCPFSSESTDTGHMFTEVFQLLVCLSNECEIGGEWVVGAPLAELPLSEQILVLHRLDHSIHTMRLWAIHESNLIAHTWELETFFLLVKGDIPTCINELSYLKLADHTADLLAVPSVQVYVCAKMRSKIVSEVNANILLLKESSINCISTLAKICRVVSLANLHMCFPISNNWRARSTIVNISPNNYVDVYLERILLPVLEVIEDHEISNMVLKIMCEAWLDYIYLHRIKFSELGAQQLLTDFARVSHWVTECSIISPNIKERLLKNEVLRRCEGVGRLLLRHPGEAIAMQKKIPVRSGDNGSPESLGLERMPAEMYVPNQEQWLELRAGKFYSTILCCTE